MTARFVRCLWIGIYIVVGVPKICLSSLHHLHSRYYYIIIHPAKEEIMALFQDFSFSKPSSRRIIYDEVPPQEDIHPSRSPSPFSSSSSNKRPSISDSIYDFSDQSLSTYSSAPISTRLVGPDRRRNSLAREYFETIRARRQCAVRQQCDPRRASAIRLYVENLLSEDASCPELHPSSVGMNFPSPRRSAPLQTSSYCYQTSNTTSEEEGEDDDEVEAMKGLTIVEKAGGGQRLVSGPSIASRKRHSVQKNIKLKSKPARTRH